MMHVPFSSYQAFSGQQKHKVEKVKKKKRGTVEQGNHNASLDKD
jgi:hypothetical protein